MGKFYGKIGFVRTVETAPGVFSGEEIIERKYYGDILYNRVTWQGDQQLNDNFKTSNQISILADTFAYENLSIIKYAEWMGVKWKVTAIDPSKRPRFILTLGGEYNG